MNFKAFVVIVCASLSACSSLDSVPSKPLSDDVSFVRYDSKNKVRYNAYNNNTHLKVILSTNDKGSFVNILKGGLTLYFNDEAKKKKTTFVNYPVVSKVPQGSPSGDFESGRSERGAPDLNTFILQIPKVIRYSFNDSIQRLTKQESDIEVKLYAEGPELFYEILIPFSRITKIPKADLSEITVGVFSGEIKLPESPGSRAGFSQDGGDSFGGSRGGGGRGGSSAGGQRGGGGHSGGRPQSGGDRPERPTSSNPIALWFKVVLD